jgi:hypothetical protein
MDPSMARETERQTMLEIKEPDSEPTTNMMDLGR